MINTIDEKEVSGNTIHFWVVNNKTGESKRIRAMSPVEAVWLCDWLFADCEVHLVSEGAL